MSRGAKTPRAAWEALIGLARGCFRAPSFALFTTLLTRWVLAPGRRTVNPLWTVGTRRRANGSARSAP